MTLVGKLFTADESSSVSIPPKPTTPAIPPEATDVKPGVIAGSVVGVILAMSLLVAMALFQYKRRTQLDREEDVVVNSGVVHQRQRGLGVLTTEEFGMSERVETVSPIGVYSPVHPYRPFSTSAESEPKSYEMPV